jgi:hypothetical protein
VVDPGRVGQRILEVDRPIGAGEPTEEGDGSRSPPGTSGGEIDDVDGDRVARLGALDVERAGLGVYKAEVDLLA